MEHIKFKRDKGIEPGIKSKVNKLYLNLVKPLEQLETTCNTPVTLETIKPLGTRTMNLELTTLN
jgi:hypothetical protein